MQVGQWVFNATIDLREPQGLWICTCSTHLMLVDCENERSSADSLFRKGNAQLYPFHFEIVPGSQTGSDTGSAARNYMQMDS